MYLCHIFQVLKFAIYLANQDIRCAILQMVAQVDGSISKKYRMDDMGPVTKKLRDTLTGIQMGHIEGPDGWVHEIKCD